MFQTTIRRIMAAIAMKIARGGVPEHLSSPVAWKSGLRNGDLFEETQSVYRDKCCSDKETCWEYVKRNMYSLFA